jgi:hypothetical protein
MDKDKIIKELKEENVKLKEELQATKEHLKKYTAPATSSMVNYEKHKESKRNVSPLYRGYVIDAYGHC